VVILKFELGHLV